MTQVLRMLQALALTLAIALGGLGLFGCLEQPARADLDSGQVFVPIQCSPTRSSGGPPCYEVAGAYCDYFGKSSSCAPAPNPAFCRCAPI